MTYVKRHREIEGIKKKKGQEKTETKNENKRSKESRCGACQKNKIKIKNLLNCSEEFSL